MVRGSPTFQGWGGRPCRPGLPSNQPTRRTQQGFGCRPVGLEAVLSLFWRHLNRFWRRPETILVPSPHLPAWPSRLVSVGARRPVAQLAAALVLSMPRFKESQGNPYEHLSQILHTNL